MESFIIHTPHQMLLHEQIKEDEVGRASVIYGRENIYGFGGEKKSRNVVEDLRIDGDDIKVDLKQVGRVWTVLV